MGRGASTRYDNEAQAAPKIVKVLLSMLRDLQTPVAADR